MIHKSGQHVNAAVFVVTQKASLTWHVKAFVKAEVEVERKLEKTPPQDHNNIEKALPMLRPQAV